MNRGQRHLFRSRWPLGVSGQLAEKDASLPQKIPYEIKPSATFRLKDRDRLIGLKKWPDAVQHVIELCTVNPHDYLWAWSCPFARLFIGHRAVLLQRQIPNKRGSKSRNFLRIPIVAPQREDHLRPHFYAEFPPLEAFEDRFAVRHP